jgi:enoyl-CoA hydratase
MTAVLTEIRDRTLLITLNRPEVRNAVNGDIAIGVEAAVDQLEDNDDLLIGVITGNGPVFCAGADLKVLAGPERPLRAGSQVDTNTMPALTKRGHFAGFVNRERTKPVIAAVNGPAVAGGFEIVLACDIVVATTTAVFGLPEVKRSLLAFAGGVFRSPRALPLNVAMEMALTGEPIDVERAYSLGFVNRIVEPVRLLDEALALANVITANAPLAVREIRQIVRGAVHHDDHAQFLAAREASRRLENTEDYREGPRAFVEKRPPVWKGR